ncbi:tRNA (adenine(22)-N(1))-methyltransferase [Propionispira raffinosivorans]|uniref:tRNA (adenine(22)-N(1))-methyltransferase n=1 Tax=Propionispira raffinosivorans TaxID=86959 RepID=UPI00035EBC6A|nr:class I SAM-dependent methyltransferase [Propionispira raffinosivorans]
MNLGPRLLSVAKFVPKGSVVADIGTDHAYLPISLVENKIVDKAFACDVHAGPYQVAQKTILAAGVSSQIDVRFGDGITVLSPGEVDVLTIAGMGGALMIDILSKCPRVTADLKGVVLQPMNGAALLRSWLYQNGWKINEEDLVFDEGRLYEVMYAVHGYTAMPEDLLMEIGPMLWQNRHILLRQHIENLLFQSKRVLRGMANSEQAKQSEKYSFVLEKIKELEDRMQCL